MESDLIDLGPHAFETDVATHCKDTLIAASIAIRRDAMKMDFARGLLKGIICSIGMLCLTSGAEAQNYGGSQWSQPNVPWSRPAMPVSHPAPVQNRYPLAQQNQGYGQATYTGHQSGPELQPPIYSNQPPMGGSGQPVYTPVSNQSSYVNSHRTWQPQTQRISPPSFSNQWEYPPQNVGPPAPYGAMGQGGYRAYPVSQESLLQEPLQGGASSQVVPRNNVAPRRNNAVPPAPNSTQEYIEPGRPTQQAAPHASNPGANYGAGPTPDYGVHENWTPAYGGSQYNSGPGYGAGGQMLGGGCADGSCGVYGGQPYGVTSPWGSCNTCGYAPCVCRPCGAWFGGVNALLMTRLYENDYSWSRWTPTSRDRLLESNDANFDMLPGVEAYFGFCTGHGWSWSVGYWGLYTDSAHATVGGMPSTRMQTYSNLSYMPAGQATNTVDYWYDQADSHRICRSNKIDSFELTASFPICPDPCNPCSRWANCMGGCAPCNTGSYGGGCADGSCGVGGCETCGPTFCGPMPKRCVFNWFTGFRYFRFEEQFEYASSIDGYFNYLPCDMYHRIDVDNNLFGWQIGGNGEICLGHRLTLTGKTKFGVYNNHIDHRQRIGGSSGLAYVNNGSYAGSEYCIKTNKDALAFIGELDLGLAYRVTKHWRATVGYRAFVATGIATSPGQIPYNAYDLDSVNRINSSDRLVLHGLYIGGEFLY